jgi:signal transduction histidine kinase
MTLMTVGALAVAWEFWLAEWVQSVFGHFGHSDGTEWPWLQVITSTIFAAIAMVLPLLIALRSIESRKDAFEAQSTAKCEAEKANRVKGNFLAHMSHELRTPLNAMLGFGEIIRDERFGKNDPRYAEYAAHIVSSATHLLDLINDVLDLSKLDLAQHNLAEEDVSIEEIVNASLVLVRPQAEENGIRLWAKIDDGVPTLRADPQKIRQILANLLSNAVKFTPSDGEVTLTAWSDADGCVVFQIADTGIGMTPDGISKALSPFQQVDHPLNRKYPGTGLGLPIAKSLIELHGGTLSLESAVEEGTTVTVCLPQNRTVQQLSDVDTDSTIAQAS